jgi:hypothetical protein
VASPGDWAGSLGSVSGDVVISSPKDTTRRFAGSFVPALPPRPHGDHTAASLLASLYLNPASA